MLLKRKMKQLLISVLYLDYNYALRHLTLDLSTRYSHVHHRFENYLLFQCFWNKNHLKRLALGNDFFFPFSFLFFFCKAACASVMHSRSQSLPLPAVHRHSNKAGNTLTQLRCRSHFWQTSVQYDSPYYTLNTNFFGNIINFASLHFYLH